jgi:hypothetical protein
MFHDEGCHGRVVLGALPEDVQRRLTSVPGEWLEFDPQSTAIVVRHVQPTAGPSLPTIVKELVHMLGEVPVELHTGIAGGDLFAHTVDTPHVVRLRVERGGGVRVDWAHPSYADSRKAAYTDGREIPTPPWVCRLNGRVTFKAADAAQAAKDMQRAADTFEGLYPEGDFRATADRGGALVTVEMRDVNLDARVLVAQLNALATKGSLSGTVDVSSFDERHPDERVRLLFQDGKTWVQEPFLWQDDRPTGI